jgi:hypothetical protein
MMSAPVGGEVTPGSDGYSWAYYEVEDVSSPTKIMYDVRNTDGNLLVDGIEVAPAENYQFSAPGRHLVKWKDTSGTGGYNRFAGVTTLTEVYMCADMQQFYGGIWFSGCSSLRVLSLDARMVSFSFAQITNCNLLSLLLMPGVTTIGGRLDANVLPSLKQLILPSIVRFGWDNDSTGICERDNVRELIDLGPNIQNIGKYVLYASPVPVMVVRATTPPTLVQRSLSDWPKPHTIYVPYSSDHSVLDAYKTAQYWDGQADCLFELNPDGTIPTT